MEASEEVPLELDAARIVARTQGREGCCGRASASSAAPLAPPPIPRSHAERLLMAAERLEAELDVERRANEACASHGESSRPVLLWAKCEDRQVRGLRAAFVLGRVSVS